MRRDINWTTKRDDGSKYDYANAMTRQAEEKLASGKGESV